MQTLEDYINAARILLQDTAGTQRYSDAEFKLAFDIAFDEAYRIRPDLFLEMPDPLNIVGENLSYEPPVPRGYQSPFLYYICGHVQLRDAEETEDNRAGVFINKFTAQLLATAA